MTKTLKEARAEYVATLSPEDQKSYWEKLEDIKREVENEYQYDIEERDER